MTLPKISAKALFTRDQHVSILSQFKDDTQAAAQYNVLGGFDEPVVYRQMVRYWRQVFIDNEGRAGAANNHIKEARKLIQPSPTDDIGDTVVPSICNRILVVGDLHAPYTHPDAIKFLRHVRDSYRPDMVSKWATRRMGTLSHFMIVTQTWIARALSWRKRS